MMLMNSALWIIFPVCLIEEGVLLIKLKLLFLNVCTLFGLILYHCQLPTLIDDTDLRYIMVILIVVICKLSTLLPLLLYQLIHISYGMIISKVISWIS